jgi:hypothetical protein
LKGDAMKHPFMETLARKINSGQSKSLVLTGNVPDWFFSERRNEFVPLLDFLLENWGSDELKKCFSVVYYQLSNPIRFLNEADIPLIKDAWVQLNNKKSLNEMKIEKLARPYSSEDYEAISEQFDFAFNQAIGNPTFALQFLRQLCFASRLYVEGKHVFNKNLIVIIDRADLVIPNGSPERVSENERFKVDICFDWLSNPGFVKGSDAVILITESLSLISERIARLPSLIEVEVSSPTQEQRLQCIEWFNQQAGDKKPKLWSTPEELAASTAGLSIQALLQMLKEASYVGDTINYGTVNKKIDAFVKSQLLGDDGQPIAEFKRPEHNLDGVVGSRKSKKFDREYLIPRLRLPGKQCLPGIAFSGAIGGGKSFRAEAVASESGIPILIISGAISKWLGQSDLNLNRIIRFASSFHKIIIMIDEADAQFSGVGADVHEAMRRYSGKILSIMADPIYKGKIIWFLMTARIHLLPEDMLRPGRIDLVIPIFDPDDEDRADFLKWALKPVFELEGNTEFFDQLMTRTKGYYAAAYSSLMSDLKSLAALRGKTQLSQQEILEFMDDLILPENHLTRRMQTLYAVLKCSRKQFLPEEFKDLDEDKRADIEGEIAKIQIKLARRKAF